MGKLVNNDRFDVEAFLLVRDNKLGTATIVGSCEEKKLMLHYPAKVFT
jgi:hypothetical protein